MKKIYCNANFFSMENEHNVYDTVLCENGLIVDVLNRGNIFEFDSSFEIIDLQGLYVFPGFIDAHTHSFEGGLYQNGIDLSFCNSISDILNCLSESKPFNDLVFAWKFDENNIKEKRFPTKAELNKANDKIPILLRRIDGHSCVVNDAAVKLFGIADIISEDGLLKGVLNDFITHYFHKKLDLQAIVECYKTAETIALKNGHTGIHTMIGDSKNDYLHFALLNTKLDEFLIDFYLYPQCFNIDGLLKAFLPLPYSLSPRIIGGCILADGSFGSYTAAISKPYSKKKCYGKLYQTQEFWNDFVCKAQENDFQVGVHCIGDRAIEQILNALEHSFQKKKKTIELRHQIIHCELVRDDMIENLMKCGVYAVMQPMFDSLWGGEEGFYAKALGVKRAKLLNRFKTLTDRGVTVVGSSDWYVTDLSAIKGINAAINHHNTMERLSNFEAIKLYTVNPPKLTHDENRKGLIKKGYVADFVCLDKNIMLEKNIEDTKVCYTIKNGNIVYKNNI